MKVIGRLTAIVLLILLWAPSAFGQCTGQLQPSTFCGNATGGVAPAGEVPATSFFDFLYGTTPGTVIYRGPSTWTSLPGNSSGTSVLSENSSGVPSFTASPVISGSVTTPLVIGGTGAASTLTMESTSGAGTTDAILFRTGSQIYAGGISALQQWTIGSNFPPATSNPGKIVLLTINANNSAPPPLDAPSALPAGNYVLDIIGPDSNTAASGINMMQFGTGSQVYPGISFHRGNGTAASPSAVLNGDVVAHFGAHPRSTTDWAAQGTAAIRYYAKENFDDTHQGTSIKVHSTALGTFSALLETIEFFGSSTILGGSDKAAPTANTLTINSVLTGTANTAGADLTFDGSKGTGTGAGGNIIFRTAPAGGAGSNQNAVVQRGSISPAGLWVVGPNVAANAGTLFTINKNTGAPTALGTPVSHMVQADGVAGSTIYDNYGGQPQLIFRRANGTQASKSNQVANDIIGSFLGIGYGATGYNANGATGAFQIIAGETWTDATALTYMDFFTTPTGSITPARAMRLQGSGGLSLGTTTDPGAGVFLANTAVQSALVKGGTAANSTLTLESTSGAGTTDSIIWKTASQVTRATMLSNGNLGVGTETNPQASLVVSQNAQTGLAVGAGTQIAIMATDAASPILEMDGYGVGSGGTFVFRDARGTGASPSNLSTSDVIGSFGARPFTNGAFTGVNTGRIDFLFTDSSPNNGTAVVFNTTPNGSTTRAEASRVQGSGGFSVGTTTDPGIGKITVLNGYNVGATAGQTVTTTVRAAGGAADCTLIFTGGIKTGGTC